MKIALSYRVDSYPVGDTTLSAKQLGRLVSVPVETYCQSVSRAFNKLGHETTNVYGLNTKWRPQDFDLYIELDNGRDGKGQLGFGQQLNRSDIQLDIPTAVWFIDSHGQPDLHKALSVHYDHVFFAVWDKRELFAGHSSAHWCPNATDPEFFFPKVVGEPEFDFGFFGSKTGLERSDPMVEICKKRGWAYDVRQVGGGSGKHKWPRTSDAMNNCRTLFNHGQKHDGPNLRVVESMAVGRPLITDSDPRSGMDRLFTPGEHYLGYTAYSYLGLEEKMEFAMAHQGWCHSMAMTAQKLVLEKHLVKHRVEQMIAVFNATV